MNKGNSNYEQDFIWQSLDEIWGAPGSHKHISVSALPEYLKEVEFNEIDDALKSHNGNVAAASRHLGIGRTRLIARMKVLGIKKGRQ